MTVPLGGCPITGYTAAVTIDGQVLQLLVDTGSTDTAVAMTTCESCDTPASLDPTNDICSTTQVMAEYGEYPYYTGWTGDLCTSTVQVGAELPAVTMDFAGITTQMDFFRTYDCAGRETSKSPIDGIIGFGPLDLSDLGGHTDDAYFNELVQQGVTNSFGVLLCTQGGGDMWFGGYDSSFASGPIQYTPNTGMGAPAEEQFWMVDLSAIGIGTGTAAVDLEGSDARGIVDTGTTLFQMPKNAFNNLVTFLSNDSHAASVFGSGALDASLFNNLGCVTTTAGQTRAEVDATLLPLTFRFPAVGGGSFTIVLPPTQSYLSYSAGSTPQYCAAAVSSGSNAAGSSILGDAVLGSHITVFDIAQNQIGFAPQTTCD